MMGITIYISRKYGILQGNGGSSGRKEIYLDTQLRAQKNNFYIKRVNYQWWFMRQE